MSHPSRPSACLRGLAATLLLVTLAGPNPLHAQAADRWQSTVDEYDPAAVESQVETLRHQFADRHGPLAKALWDLREGLMVTPHQLESRPAPPFIPPMRFTVEAAHLVHYQASRGGSLGVLHGSVQHPIGLAWFPHSMFAQSGGVFGIWGHARLLGAVEAHAARHGD